MTPLPESLRAWPSEGFARALKSEIESLPPDVLPLAEAASANVDDSPITATVLRVEEGEGEIRAKVGIFFAEILTGCSCGYEPEPQSAYCEILLKIDKATGAAEFDLAPETP